MKQAPEIYKGKKFKTRYSSIVPKGKIGICVDESNIGIGTLKIEFPNKECFWFMARDLKEVE